MTRGMLVGSYTVGCGVCGEVEPLVNVRATSAASEARGKGWVTTAAHGWVCPECAAARRVAAEPGTREGVSTG